MEKTEKQNLRRIESTRCLTFNGDTKTHNETKLAFERSSLSDSNTKPRIFIISIGAIVNFTVSIRIP
jgi:hypothetical protein